MNERVLKGCKAEIYRSTKRASLQYYLSNQDLVIFFRSKSGGIYDVIYFAEGQSREAELLAGAGNNRSKSSKFQKLLVILYNLLCISFFFTFEYLNKHK